jgi:hypothetical protein
VDVVVVADVVAVVCLDALSRPATNFRRVHAHDSDHVHV